MASTVPVKRGLADDSEDERSRSRSGTNKSDPSREKTRRQHKKSKRVDFTQSNKLDENEQSQETENLSPPPTSSPSEAHAHQTGRNDWTVGESNVLSELDRAATRIIETHRRSNGVTKKELDALKEELGVVRGELEASKEELEASKEELEIMKRSRDEALDQLGEKKKLVDLFEFHATIYRVEFNSARDELADAEVRLRDTRAENNRFFQEKQKAEKGSADLENRAERAEKMAEWHREQLASERARVCEFELKHGMIVL